MFPYLSQTFIMGNLVWILAALLAVVYTESTVAVEATVVLLAISMIHDIIAMSVWTKDLSKQDDEYKFSLAAAIIGIIIKPATIAGAIFEFMNRGGQVTPPSLSSGSASSSPAGSYQNVDAAL